MKSVNKEKIVKTTIKNSQNYNMLQSFNKRWGIMADDEEKEKFKNRSLSILRNCFNSVGDYSRRRLLIEKFCDDVNVYMGFSPSDNLWDKFENTKTFREINKLNMRIETEYYLFLSFIEFSLNNFRIHCCGNNDLAKEISEALKLSNINAIVCKNDDLYQLYPIDDELISEKLVSDVLIWLNDYPDAKKTYLRALKTPKIEDKYRSIIDDLRLSLEFFLKQLFSNDKTLENQKNNIGNYFKTYNVSVEISNMYMTLLNYYEKYNNNNAKHGDRIAEVEIDYIVYLTGSFIRFLMLIEKCKIN